MPSAVALIGARAGSERVPGKNIRLLAGHPLLAYAIETARQSEVFDRIVVSTDSEEIAKVARWYGADVPFLRPDGVRDLDLARHRVDRLDAPTARGALRPVRDRPRDESISRAGRDPPRPREAARDARGGLRSAPSSSSSSTRGRCGSSTIDGRTMRPLLDQSHLDVAWHAGQYQALPPVYVQNSALEIAWTRVVEATGTREGACSRRT